MRGGRCSQSSGHIRPGSITTCSVFRPSCDLQSRATLGAVPREPPIGALGGQVGLRNVPRRSQPSCWSPRMHRRREMRYLCYSDTARQPTALGRPFGRSGQSIRLLGVRGPRGEAATSNSDWTPRRCVGGIIDDSRLPGHRLPRFAPFLPGFPTRPCGVTRFASRPMVGFARPFFSLCSQS